MPNEQVTSRNNFHITNDAAIELHVQDGRRQASIQNITCLITNIHDFNAVVASCIDNDAIYWHGFD